MAGARSNGPAVASRGRCREQARAATSSCLAGAAAGPRLGPALAPLLASRRRLGRAGGGGAATVRTAAAVSAPTRPARGSAVLAGSSRLVRGPLLVKGHSRRSCRCLARQEGAGEGRPRIPGLGWKLDPSPDLPATAAARTGRA